MFVKIDTKGDRRLVKAMRELMPEEFETETLMASPTVVYIEHKDPIGLLESYLDRFLPDWRKEPTVHFHRQGASFTRELMLLRMWHLCRSQHPELVPVVATVVTEQESVKRPSCGERVTLAMLYPVPAAWLVEVPIEVKPMYYAAAATEPKEKFVRRPERELRDPVRCGRCSEQVEYNQRGKHASLHACVVADIEWTPVTRFRRE